MHTSMRTPLPRCLRTDLQPRCLYFQCRRAHAAALDPESSSHPRARRPHPRAGRPTRSSPSDYRFPTARNGRPPSPYEVLGLSRSASPAEIKSSYYKLALLLHPDSSHPSASAEHFATLAKAYKLLSTSAGRNSYLQSGSGWSESPQDAMDSAMREWARRAKAGGAASWEAGQAARGGFRDSDAGRGAWAFYHHRPGEDFPFHDAPPQGDGKPVYMANEKFFGLIAAIAGIVAIFQFGRLGRAADRHKDLLIERHVEASNALAEARREAALYGRERRDKIRRRVRETAVMQEIGKMERGEWSEFSHGAKEVPVIEAPRSEARREGRAE